VVCRVCILVCVLQKRGERGVDSLAGRKGSGLATKASVKGTRADRSGLDWPPRETE